MKYAVGGRFWFRHPGDYSAPISKIDENGKYHFETHYENDSYTEEELNNWNAPYAPPEYFKKLLMEKAYEMVYRIYPESQRETAIKSMNEFFKKI